MRLCDATRVDACNNACCSPLAATVISLSPSFYPLSLFSFVSMSTRCLIVQLYIFFIFYNWVVTAASLVLLSLLILFLLLLLLLLLFQLTIIIINYYYKVAVTMTSQLSTSVTSVGIYCSFLLLLVRSLFITIPEFKFIIIIIIILIAFLLYSLFCCFLPAINLMTYFNIIIIFHFPHFLFKPPRQNQSLLYALLFYPFINYQILINEIYTRGDKKWNLMMHWNRKIFVIKRAEKIIGFKHLKW